MKEIFFGILVTISMVAKAQKLEVVNYTFDDDRFGLTQFNNRMNTDSTDYGLQNGKYVYQVHNKKKGVTKWVTFSVGLSSSTSIGYKASLTQLAGLQDYGYGMVLNAENGNNYIMFGISSSGYYMVNYGKAGIATNVTKGWVKSSLIKTGLNATNEIYVEKTGNTYQFFVNDVAVVSQQISLAKFTPNVGLFANSEMKVAFEQLQVHQWTGQAYSQGKIQPGYKPLTSLPVAARPVPTQSKQTEVYSVNFGLYKSGYGLKDKDGFRLVDPVYRNGYISEKFFIAESDYGNLFGVYDLEGKVIIPPIMKAIKASKSNGEVYFSCKSESGFWGLINQSGKTVLPFIYSYLDHVSEGHVYIKNSKGWGLVDLNGLPKILPGTVDDKAEIEKVRYRFPVKLKDGRLITKAKAGDGGKVGIMDLTGKWVIMPKYHSINSLDTNQQYIASAPKVGETNRIVWGVIDKNGKEIIPFKYSSISNQAKNYIVAEGNDPGGYDEIKSADAEKDEEDEWDDLFEGFDAVENRKWGVLTSNGAELVPVKQSMVEITNDKNVLIINQNEIVGGKEKLKNSFLIRLKKQWLAWQHMMSLNTTLLSSRAGRKDLGGSCFLIFPEA
ncbi:WG repeat-containing protein [Sediminibacterium sp. C3]|uniref:WG repeat-containing protein n=1 Tax=Sediminibacterium sp. C3 TaxID=1267211 RepID=UPI0003FBFAB9|nr:WG repeat-containing protein [Sediminibacterium sp. C3]